MSGSALGRDRGTSFGGARESTKWECVVDSRAPRASFSPIPFPPLCAHNVLQLSRVGGVAGKVKRFKDLRIWGLICIEKKTSADGSGLVWGVVFWLAVFIAFVDCSLLLFRELILPFCSHRFIGSCYSLLAVEQAGD